MTHPPGDRPRRIAAAHDVVGGRYRLRESLGGSRVVWRAHDDLLDREVAVREVGTPPGSTSSEILDRQLATMLEALAAGAVDHPGIVPVLDVVWRPDRCWIVMAYVPGRSLREAVEADGPLDRRTAAATGLALLGALRAAHAAGLAHGDVRPGTVLLADDGRVLLTDFGLGGTGGSAAGDVLALASTIAAAVSDVDRVT
ncbi:MAG TPA: protein kinase, partial [Actinoplanes sp.]|nr:protein kinase [Actinoplanes sp.]